MARKTKRKNEPRFAWLPDRENFTRVLTNTTTVVLFLGLSIGLLAGRGALQARATEVVRETVKVHFDWPPLAGAAAPRGTWLDERTQHQLTSIALQNISADPFDGASLAKAREALAATGWFASGPVLRRESAGVVRVEGTWRVPFAAVRVGNNDHLVTPRGERLDKFYTATASRFRVILNAAQPLPPRFGDVWSGMDVHAGLMLLSTVGNRPWANQVAGVDVGEFTPKNQRQLVLVTTTGGRIRWGGPVESPLPGEAATAVKLRHLDTLAQSGPIANGQPYLDIRFKNVFVGDAAVQSGR